MKMNRGRFCRVGAVVGLLSLGLGVSLFLSSCSGPEASQAQKAYGTALKPGEVLEFKNPNGSGKVHYVSEFHRRYDVLGGSSDVTLVQRPAEFRHQRGIYSPGEGSHWPRFVVEDSEAHFSNLHEVDAFLKEGAYDFQWVANSDGYVVGYCVTPERSQINVSVYRFYLKGHLMRSIPREYRAAGFVSVKREAVREER